MKENNIQDSQISFLFITIIILLSVALNSENSIYMQFFPKLTHYYNVNIDETGYILRASFAGSVIFGLFVGPLADSFGRKRIFIGGVILYVLSSLACFLAKDFNTFLFWRFIEGMARAVPVVVAWLMVFDQYSVAKSGKQVNFVQGASSLVAVSIPVLSVDISKYINWHDIILISSIMAFVCLIMISGSVEETLPIEKRKPFNFKTVLNNYLKLLKNKNFMIYVLIFCISTMNYNVFFSNASIVFVDHLGLSRESYSYYQTLNTVFYIIASFLGMKLIAYKGIDYAKNVGLVIFISGCVASFVTALVNDTDIEAIFAAIMITAIGAPLMSGFMIRAVNMFPDMRGTAMTLCSSLSLLIAARGSFWAQKFFNDTIIPAVTVIFICSMIALSLFVWLMFTEKETEVS